MFDFSDFSGKTNKIKQKSTVCSDRNFNGLKMVYVKGFIKSLKVSWVRRIFCEVGCQWLTLFNEMYGYNKNNCLKMVHVIIC